MKQAYKIIFTSINVTLIVSIIIFLLTVFSFITVDYQPLFKTNSLSLHYFSEITGMYYWILIRSLLKVLPVVFITFGFISFFVKGMLRINRYVVGKDSEV